MRASYAVLWQETGGEPCSGELELGESCLRLEGSRRAGNSMRSEIPYDEIAGLRVGRAAGDRLDGRSTLILDRRGSASLLVTSTTGLGMNREIEERLRRLLGEARAG